MTNSLWRCAARLLCVIAMVIALPGAWAQEAYPSRSMRVIVPWPAGGSVDFAVRVVTERLSRNLGQPVVVDNRPGAAGNIGAAVAAKAAPDGYTLLIATSPMVISRALNPNLPIDPVKDFTPVSQLVNANNVLVSGPSMTGSIKELVEKAKAKPGQITYASSGTGTQLHLLGAAFGKQAGIDIVHVPYKGGPPALLDLVGGQVDMMIPGFPVVQSYLKSGQVKALAVASKHRLALLPDVPTMAEAGYPGIDSVEWYGVVAPAGTPEAIVSRINKEIVGILNAPEVRTLLANRGFEAAGSTPGEFGALIVSEQTKWAGLIKQIGVRVE